MNVSRKLLVRIAITLFVIAVPTFVFANSVTYTYTGPDFNVFSVNSNWVGANPFTTSNFISGSFTVNGVLADGNYDLLGAPPAGATIGTWSNGYGTGSSPEYFKLTVSGGVITQWFISIYATQGYAETLNCTGLSNPCGFGAVEDQGVIDINNVTFQQAIGKVWSVGSWKETSNAPVPEPGSLALMMTGITGVLPLARKFALRRDR